MTPISRTMNVMTNKARSRGKVHGKPKKTTVINDAIYIPTPPEFKGVGTNSKS